MKIAICDDEVIFVNKIYKYLWQQPECSVDCFASPVELLAKYKVGERYDVVFLDIMMAPINGIDVAKEIRQFDKHGILVFLTSYLEYAPIGYEVNAFRYLLKPITEEDIARVMKDIFAELSVTHTLLIKTPECEFVLHTQYLQYIEANDKNSILYYKDDTISMRKSLNELEVLLPTDIFFRIHRKYLVNLSNIREFDNSNLTLDCGQTLPISRRKWKEFRNALTTYIEGALQE